MSCRGLKLFSIITTFTGGLAEFCVQVAYWDCYSSYLYCQIRFQGCFGAWSPKRSLGVGTAPWMPMLMHTGTRRHDRNLAPIHDMKFYGRMSKSLRKALTNLVRRRDLEMTKKSRNAAGKLVVWLVCISCTCWR